MTRVIGIAGGSGSGKSFLARALAEELIEAVILPADAYYHDQSHLSYDPSRPINFDHPRAIDTPLLLKHLHTLLRGQSVEIPRYEFRTHRRRRGPRLEPAPWIILEGLFVLHEHRLRPHLTLKIYVDTPGELRVLRRIQRDTQQRHISLRETCRLLETFVLPMHERFVEPSRAHADLVWRQSLSHTPVRPMLRKILRHPYLAARSSSHRNNRV